MPPPTVAAHPGTLTEAYGASPSPLLNGSTKDDLSLDLVIPALEAAGLEPLPERGASDDEIEAWVERFIDASARPDMQEADHAR